MHVLIVVSTIEVFYTNLYTYVYVFIYIYICMYRERKEHERSRRRKTYLQYPVCTPQEAWQGLATWLPGIDVRTVLVGEFNKRRARRARLRF